MNTDAWYELKERLTEKFGNLKESNHSESREDDVGHTITTKFEEIEFESELGSLKIQRATRPKIIDKRSHYHKGAGAAKVEYILSDNEETSKVTVFKKNEVGEWQELELPAERLNF